MDLREVFEIAHSFNSYTEFEDFIANKLDGVPLTVVTKHTYKLVSSSNVIPDVVHQREQFKSMVSNMANKLAIAGNGDTVCRRNNQINQKG